LQINDLVSRIAKPRLQTVTGAADVRIFGERKYAMRVWLDPDKLAAYKLTTQDAEDAIRRSNLEVPAGRIESSQREFSVTSQTDLQRPNQFSDIIIKNANGFPVRIRDVGRVQEGAVDERSSTRLNGRAAITAGVIRQATANPLDLSNGVRAMIPKLQADLPPGVSIDIANDNSVFIDRSIKNVFSTILEAVLLVALVVFLFLRTLRASIIPVITIPVCLIGTFSLMSLAGFSINTLTLLALVLAIGLVVDDAIVVLENIYRHIEEGLDPFSASIKGAKEVGFAVVAMTLTLAAVYAPLAFTPGRTGRLFIEFALALAGAVVVSGFIALTLSPMMCSLLLKHNPNPSWFDRNMEKLLNFAVSVYERMLTWLVSTRYDRDRAQMGIGAKFKRFFLDTRWIVIGVMLVCAWGIYSILPNMKRELAPLEDRGQVLAVVTALQMVQRSTTPNRYVAGAGEESGDDYPEFDRIFANIGNPTVSQGECDLQGTVDWEKRERSTTLDMAREMQPKSGRALPGGHMPSRSRHRRLGQGFRERPVTYVIQTSDSYQNLATAVAPPNVGRDGQESGHCQRRCRSAAQQA
jgi:multidrug efflux pump